MRTIALLIIAVQCRAQAPQSPVASEKVGHVEGIVTNVAGEPLQRATVRLIGQPSFVAETGVTGKFAIESIPPGRYTLYAERAGYVRQVYGARIPGKGGAVFSLGPGQRLSGIELKLTQQGIVQGRVTDEYGEPVANARVAIHFKTYLSNRQLFLHRSVTAGAEGEFSIGELGPDRYYISASDPISSARARDAPTAGAVTQGHVTTYYPGVIRAADATGVEVGPGAEIRGLEIRLQKTPVYRIRGRIAENTPPRGSLAVAMEPAEPSIMNDGNRQIGRNFADGSFEFTGVSPGEYTLLILMTPGIARSDQLTGYRRITITDQNVDDLVLALWPPAVITGGILREGSAEKDSAAGGLMPRVTLTIDGEIPGRSTYTADPKADGTFVLSGVMPAKYRVVINRLGEGVYLKSVRFGGSDVTHNLLDLTAGSDGKLDVQVSSGAADVNGVVRNSHGEAVPSVTVSLWSPGRGSDGAVEFVADTSTGLDGTFRISAIPPGKYRIAAWEEIVTGLWAVPEFLHSFEGKAIEVELGENQHANVDPALISSQAIEREESRLR